jgi:hypothetical protein
MKQQYKKVMISWVDAIVHTDTVPVSDAIKHNPYPRESVGYLLKKTKEKIVLCMTFDKKDMHADTTLIIPYNWILKITELK